MEKLVGPHLLRKAEQTAQEPCEPVLSALGEARRLLLVEFFPPSVCKLICQSRLAAAVTQYAPDPKRSLSNAGPGVQKAGRREAAMSGNGGKACLGHQRNDPGCLQPGAEGAVHVPFVHHFPPLTEKIPTFPTKSSAGLHVPRNPLEPPAPGDKAHFSKPLLDRGAAWLVYVTGQPPEACVIGSIHKIHARLA